MSEHGLVLDTLAHAVAEGDDRAAAAAAQAALDAGMEPLDVVERGLSPGMDVVGERFESGDAYLPDLLMAAQAFKAAMDLLGPAITARKQAVANLGTVLIGTVRGDLHTIGKNLVATVLRTQGIDVVDVGADSSPLRFIREAERARADVIALSSLMTTTMPAQQEVIEVLKELGARDQYKVIVGGGPVTQAWADEIGADGYGASALEAAALVRRLLL